MTTDDAALDALAAALAPRLLREVRALIEAEGPDDDHELGLAVMARLGFSPGRGAGSALEPPQQLKRKRAKPRRSKSPRG